MGERLERAISLGARLGVPWDAAQVEASLARLHAKRRRRRAAGFALALGLAVASVTSALLHTAPAATVADHLSPPAQRENPAQSPRLSLRDGSSAHPEPGAVLVVVEDAADRTTLELRAGVASFEILHRPERRLTVRVNELSIVDVGTVFRVDRRPARVNVAVLEGEVRVELPGQTHALTAGEARWFNLGAGLTREPPGPAAAPPLPRSPKREVAASAPDRDEPEELLLAADAARRSGRPEEAILPLERLVQRHGADPRAPLAAFTLGKVWLAAGRPADAATAFAAARSLRPDGPLVEEALGRELEAWESAQRPGLARDRSREYLQRYPDGTRAAAARRLADAP